MSHPKNELLEQAQKLELGKPQYRTRNEGSAHEPVFKTEVVLGGSVIGRGQANQKRLAERQAAQDALEHLVRLGSRAPEQPGEPTSAEFAGPWPIFDAVLAASLHVANSRLNPDALGPETLKEVREMTLDLYKSLLEHLGEVVEIEEEET